MFVVIHEWLHMCRCGSKNEFRMRLRQKPLHRFCATGVSHLRHPWLSDAQLNAWWAPAGCKSWPIVGHCARSCNCILLSWHFAAVGMRGLHLLLLPCVLEVCTPLGHAFSTAVGEPLFSLFTRRGLPGLGVGIPAPAPLLQWVAPQPDATSLHSGHLHLHSCLLLSCVCRVPAGRHPGARRGLVPCHVLPVLLM